MDFVLLIAVLVITGRASVTARPKDPPIESEEPPTIAGMVFKFPTKLSDGLTVTINGTVNSTKYEKLTALVLTSGEKSEDSGNQCKILHHFKDQYVEVSPVHEDEEYNRVEYPVNETYGVPFSIRMTAKINHERHMLRLSFYRNDSDIMNPITCPVTNIEDFDHIILEDGVETVTSILFEFAT